MDYTTNRVGEPEVKMVWITLQQVTGNDWCKVAVIKWNIMMRNFNVVMEETAMKFLLFSLVIAHQGLQCKIIYFCFHQHGPEVTGNV